MGLKTCKTVKFVKCNKNKMLLKMFQNYEDSMAVIFEPSLHGFSNTSQHTVINVASTNARKIFTLQRKKNIL